MYCCSGGERRMVVMLGELQDDRLGEVGSRLRLVSVRSAGGSLNLIKAGARTSDVIATASLLPAPRA